MQLTEHIYLAASGKWGFGLTNLLDCNAYCLDAGNGAVLIDAGSGLEPERVDAVLSSHGFSPASLRAIFLTHYHADHACGAARLAALSGCPVWAPAPEAPAIAAGDDVATGLAPNRGGSYPADFVYPPCPGVRGLADGETVSVGALALTAHLVPGHSLCDMVLSAKLDGRSCLFSGDAVFANGEVLLQSLPDVCVYDYAKAVRALSALPADALFPGHGLFCLSGGAWHVRRCAEQFASGLVPRQFHYFA